MLGSDPFLIGPNRIFLIFNRVCPGSLLKAAYPGNPTKNKKKPAVESGLKTIFLEENSGDKAEYAARPHICPIAKSDTRHIAALYLQVFTEMATSMLPRVAFEYGHT
jgi:hypothetical protein